MTMVLLSALVVPPFRGQARLQTGGRGKWNNKRGSGQGRGRWSNHRWMKLGELTYQP